MTVGGKTSSLPLLVTMDPRVRIGAEALAQQFALSMQCYDGLRQAREAAGQVQKLRAKVNELRAKTKDEPLAGALAELEQKLAALEGAQRRRGERPGPGTVPREPAFARTAADLQHLLDLLQGTDAAPTTQAVAACEQARQALDGLLSRWGALRDKDLKDLNKQLRKAGLPLLGE